MASSIPSPKETPLTTLREEREAFYEKLWQDGGFRYWLGNYKDYLFDKDANQAAYDFWVKKQSSRLNDQKNKDILVPKKMPHYWGIKRPCLEFAYLEQFNRDNVEVVDIKNNGIKGFDETGINLEDGTHYDFDVICIATGFDVVTGGMTAMGLRDIYGNTLDDQWKKAAYTYLGTTVADYPNMFHLYGYVFPKDNDPGFLLTPVQTSRTHSTFQRSYHRRSPGQMDHRCHQIL